MQLFSLNFSIYTCSGVWRPIQWTSGCAKLLYNILSIFMIVSLYFMMFTQFLDLVFIVDNVNDFTTNCLIFISGVAVCFKATIAITRRSEIINLVQILLEEPCKPQDEDEVAIQTRFDNLIRFVSIGYLLLAMSSLTGVTIRSTLSIIQYELPYRAWLPYISNIPIVFWFMAIHQMIIVFLGTFANVASETLIFGFFIQTCAQLEIFEYRLNKLMIDKAVKYKDHPSSASLNKKEAVISEHIRHHLCIYKYAKTVNNVFSEILFVQFFVSILVLCSSVYYLSTHMMDSQVAVLPAYIICMFVQILVYCWSGNEVILKSVSVGSAVYHMNWLLLSISERKDLLMIMRRSVIPIRFTSSFLVTLSLKSYTTILRTSYSAFNILQKA